MTKMNLKFLVGLAVVAAFALSASQAEAGFHHRHRGWGGGYGSYGSYGGSYGSYGSGGSYGGYGSWGSWGGYGSSGGSSGGSWGSYGGGYGCCGSSGGYVMSYGSSGGSSGGYGGGYGAGYNMVPGTLTPGKQAPVNATPPTTTPTPPSPSGALPDDVNPGSSTWNNSGANEAIVSVTLPADAKVFVNGLATTSTGANRQYISRGLQAGARYNYEVRAELVRDGQTVTETKSVSLGAGQSAALNFSFPAQATAKTPGPLRTSLLINVPADAKVFLSGQEMKATGETREFSTSRLTAGEEWNGYTVRATIEHDGQLVTKEQTITLKAGDTQEVTLNFDDAQLAGR